MKKLILFLFVLTGCNYVEHEVRSDTYGILCPSHDCYWTYVWVDSKIVWSTCDDMNNLTDSLVTKRHEQATLILKNATKY